MISLGMLLSCLACTSGLDLGSAGVFDSPLATDQFVKQFGFLFGGGRSGIEGLQALQERDPKAVTASTTSPSIVSTPDSENVAARKMVELTPLTGARGDKQFNRFLAVP